MTKLKRSDLADGALLAKLAAAANLKTDEFVARFRDVAIDDSVPERTLIAPPATPSLAHTAMGGAGFHSPPTSGAGYLKGTGAADAKSGVLPPHSPFSLQGLRSSGGGATTPPPMPLESTRKLPAPTATHGVATAPHGTSANANATANANANANANAAAHVHSGSPSPPHG
jgi:hypothetical protein